MNGSKLRVQTFRNLRLSSIATSRIDSDCVVFANNARCSLSRKCISKRFLRLEARDRIPSFPDYVQQTGFQRLIENILQYVQK